MPSHCCCCKIKKQNSVQTRYCTRPHPKNKGLSHGPTARMVLLLTSNFAKTAAEEKPTSRFSLSARKHTCRLARTWQHFGTEQVMGIRRERQHVCFCMCDPQKQTGEIRGAAEGWKGGESDFRLTSGIYLGVQKHWRICGGWGAFTGINPCDSI